MVKVKVKFLSTFHSVVDTDELDLEVPDQTNLGKLLEILSRKFGEGLAEHFRKLDYLMIFINDSEYRGLKGLDTLIRNGDKVIIGHVVAGGFIRPREATEVNSDSTSTFKAFFI